jgi:hypothetical protein
MTFLKFFLIGLLFLSIGIVSNAQNTPTPQIPNVCDKGYFGDGNTGVCSNRNKGDGTLTDQIRSIVTALNNSLIVLAPSIGVIAIIYGAFKIMANGFKAGIVIIQWALIGIVVVLLANGLLSLVISILWN